MSARVYHGPWINWDRGSFITGATITISEGDGAILTSFIATFVTLVGVQLWKILAFAIHQIQSTTKPEDGLFHQQQAVWRNTSSPIGAAWTFAQQTWYWRRRASHSFLRTFTWAMFATVYFVIFAIAAIFSSYISKAPGSQRLIMGPECGFWTIDNSSTAGGAALQQKTTNDSHNAATYARACYGGVSDPLQCGRLPVPFLRWTAKENVTCPFSAGICFPTNNSAFEVTSQMIDSYHDMGMNTPPNQRLQLQKRTTCSVIRSRNYTIEDPLNNSTNALPWQLIMYGPSLDEDGSVTIPYTEAYTESAISALVGYQLSAVFSKANGSLPVGWHPIAPLFRDDADPTLVFLKGNAISFEKPVDDPWFSAHRLLNNATSSNQPYSWFSDSLVRALGCVEQYRYCNPSDNACTNFMGSQQLADHVVQIAYNRTNMKLNPMQLAVASRFTSALNPASLYYMTNYRGPAALRAMETLQEKRQPWLPPNQWQIEVSAWFDGGLAALQQKVLEFATGPTNIVAGSYLRLPIDRQSRSLCYNQIVNDSSDTMSFSVLGLAIVFILGGIIICTSFVIDRVVALFQKWLKCDPHARRAWVLDDKLHTQRVAFEQAGQGHWKQSEDDSIPVVVGNDKFPRFPSDHLLNSNHAPDRDSQSDDNTELSAIGGGGAYGKVPEIYERERTYGYAR